MSSGYLWVIAPVGRKISEGVARKKSVGKKLFIGKKIKIKKYNPGTKNRF